MHRKVSIHAWLFLIFGYLSDRCFVLSLDAESTTPEGSPAPNYAPVGGGQQQPPAAPDTSSILKALADMAKQNSSAPPPANPLSALTAQQPAVDNHQTPQLPTATPATTGVNPYTPFGGALGGLAQNPLVSQSQAPASLAAAPTPVPANPLAALLPQATAPPPPPTLPPAAPTIAPDALQQQLQLIQLMAAQGIPQEQWATALQILSLSNSANMGGLGAAATGYGGMNPWAQPPRPADFNDRERDYGRSSANQYRRRSRSPSGRDRRRDFSPPRRRESPVYGEYRGDSPVRRGEMRGRRGGGNEYRQRTPPYARRRRSPSPKDPNLPPPGPKMVEWDYSIGMGNIKGSLFAGPYP